MKLKILKLLDRAVEYSIYGMIFFIPISIAALGVFAGFTIMFFLIKKAVSLDFSSLKSNKIPALLLLFFFIFMAMSLINSGPLIKKSIWALLIKWGRFPFLLWAIVDTFQDKKRILRAVLVFLFSATLVALSVFTQKFFGFEFLRGRTLINSSYPITGPFKNQNSLAAFLSSLTPLFLSFSLWRQRNIFIRLILYSVASILLISLYWTFCRGGWVGLTAGLFFILLFFNYQRLKKKFWVLFSFTYIFCIPLIALALTCFRSRGDGDRFSLMHGAWRMIKENPYFGKGVGTFMDYCASYTNNYGVYYAHNCYFQIWAESGIFSLLAFLLFVGYLIYLSIRVILKTPQSLYSYILIGLTASLVSYLTHSFFEVHLYSFQLSFIFWIILGLMVSLTSVLNKDDAHK